MDVTIMTQKGEARDRKSRSYSRVLLASLLFELAPKCIGDSVYGSIPGLDPQARLD
jgi:hypothetical protein